MDDETKRLLRDINNKLALLIVIIGTSSLFALFYVLTADAPFWPH